MQSSGYFRTTFIAVAASALLAGCSGANVTPSNAFQGAAPARLPSLLTGRTPQMRAAAAFPSFDHSWMAPDAGKQQLLYISDNSEQTVSVFTYPFFGLVGTLAGFKLNEGLCVDANADVFVTDAFASNIKEYAHGSITPKTTVKDPGYEPLGCAIDPTTGNLAVSNLQPSSGGGAGNVAVYKGTSGNPVAYYSAPSLFRVWFLGYDGKGNLFVDGQSSGSAFDMAELVKGKKTLRHVFLNQSIGAPGGVQWDGKYLAVGDLDAPAIYRFVMMGDKGTRIGTVSLNGGGQVVQFWIQSPKVVVPDVGKEDVGVWKYPSGGTALKTLSGFSNPFGATISTVKT